MTLGELINALGGKLAQGTAQWQIDGVSSVEFGGAWAWPWAMRRL